MEKKWFIDSNEGDDGPTKLGKRRSFGPMSTCEEYPASAFVPDAKADISSGLTETQKSRQTQSFHLSNYPPKDMSLV